MSRWRGLWCCVLLMLPGGCGHPASTIRDEPDERIKGGDSYTLHFYALLADGQFAEAEAWLADSVAQELISQEVASRLQEAMRRRRNPSTQQQPPGADYPPIAPGTLQSDPSTERRTCDTEFPTYPTCHGLPEEYAYHSVQQALSAMKQRLGAKNLVLHNPDTARAGPCPGLGEHYNVRSNGERVGSITCCACCVDVEHGPILWEKCRIVW